MHVCAFARIASQHFTPTVWGLRHAIMEPACNYLPCGIRLSNILNAGGWDGIIWHVNRPLSRSFHALPLSQNIRAHWGGPGHVACTNLPCCQHDRESIYCSWVIAHVTEFHVRACIGRRLELCCWSFLSPSFNLIGHYLDRSSDYKGSWPLDSPSLWFHL